MSRNCHSSTDRGNIPRYHFMVVTDAAKRTALAALYKRAYFEVYSPQRQAEVSHSDPRLIESATYLAEHMHEVPVLIIPCVEAPPVVQGTGPGAYASILPATWSLMLALRARGVGSAWTTLHLRYEQEAAALLGIPDGIRQAALLPVAYYTGEDFKPATRVPARERTYWNGWGQKREVCSGVEEHHGGPA
jgi:nitroreductase